ncbi:methylase [Vitiosangium sp. GDMCC 1.1324]|uniref:methylase n=1 Tax=Vitiosangium sp. (strain GDMCC 1.1324) TaxID=2138576 RepID=UPI000D383BC3|nr:methylase [Vitiosangium sp. GDMCC 1.1324]PTL77839.1 methylase [Vitiosangium sp. GDMCC 1.1324]
MTSLDRKTRGRTSHQRLQALDAYLAHSERGLLTRGDGAWARAAFVDLGFGEHPWTTLESARAFRELNPGLPVVGVELEPPRVESAREHADALTDFRQGGFELPLRPGESVRLIRAMNLLRGYRPEEVPAIHQTLGGALLEGGLLVEGSTDTPGAVLVAHLLRRVPEGISREALLFHTDFSRGFAPVLFRDWMPRDFRRRVKPGEPIHAFFADWTAAWQEVREAGHVEPPEAFRHSVLRLAVRIEGLVTDAWLLEHGYLLWKPPGGVFR